jgi:putative ABC transport system permease protein
VPGLEFAGACDWGVTVKFIPLVWAGICRKRGRAILILLQVLIAFTLYGVLQGLNTGIRHVLDKTHADRLYTGSKVSLAEPLPMSYAARIQAVPGVVAVTQRMQFGGTYQKPNQGVTVVATDPASFLKIYPEVDVNPRAAASRLPGNLGGAIVGTQTMHDRG